MIIAIGQSPSPPSPTPHGTKNNEERHCGGGDRYNEDLKEGRVCGWRIITVAQQ
jgi:hypothetical protein